MAEPIVPGDGMLENCVSPEAWLAHQRWMAELDALVTLAVAASEALTRDREHTGSPWLEDKFRYRFRSMANAVLSQAREVPGG